MSYIPGDVWRKILNKIPLSQLRIPASELTPEYLRHRAKELYNETLKTSTYLAPYEKYVQLASFNGEVTYSSYLHVPEKKVALSAVKWKTTNVLTGKKFKLSERGTLAILATKNLDQILQVRRLGIEFADLYIYNPKIPKEIYVTLYLQKQISIYHFIMGLLLPQNNIRPDVTQPDQVLIGCACAFDILKFDKLFNYLGHRDKKLSDLNVLRYYILNEYQEGKHYDIKLATLFAADDIIRKIGVSENSPINMHESRAMVYDMPKERAKSAYKAALKRIETDPGESQFYACAEYWSWRIYGKSYINSFDLDNGLKRDILKAFNVYIPALNRYMQSNRIESVTKDWCLTFSLLPVHVDILNRPYLKDIVLELFKTIPNSRDVDRDPNNSGVADYLENFYSPELYDAVREHLFSVQATELVPTSGLDIQKDVTTIPKFLEPKLEYYSNL